MGHGGGSVGLNAVPRPGPAMPSIAFVPFIHVVIYLGRPPDDANAPRWSARALWLQTKHTLNTTSHNARTRLLGTKYDRLIEIDRFGERTAPAMKQRTKSRLRVGDWLSHVMTVRTALEGRSATIKLVDKSPSLALLPEDTVLLVVPRSIDVACEGQVHDSPLKLSMNSDCDKRFALDAGFINASALRMATNLIRMPLLKSADVAFITSCLDVETKELDVKGATLVPREQMDNKQGLVSSYNTKKPVFLQGDYWLITGRARSVVDEHMVFLESAFGASAVLRPPVVSAFTSSAFAQDTPYFVADRAWMAIRDKVLQPKAAEQASRFFVAPAASASIVVHANHDEFDSCVVDVGVEVFFPNPQRASTAAAMASETELDYNITPSPQQGDDEDASKSSAKRTPCKLQ